MSLFPTQTREGNWLERHSLSVVLGVLMVVQTLLAVYDGAEVFTLEQPLGDGVALWSWDFWSWWRWHYNVSLVADSFGVLLVVLLTKWLYEKDSSQTPDDEQ